MEIDFNKNKERDFYTEKARGYYLVETQSGVLTCSCGQELIRVDNDTWRCSGGYPQWRISQREVFKDKFGNIFLKPKDHEQKKKGRHKDKYELWSKHLKRIVKRDLK